MKHLIFALMLISLNCNAKEFAESTTMDGSRIVLYTEPCKTHENSSEASIIKHNKIIALGCWKSTTDSILVIWGESLQKYSYKGWTLK